MQVVGPSCGLAPAGLVVPLGHGVHTPSAVTCSSALQVRVPVHGGVPPFIQLRKNWQLPSGQSGGSFGSNGTSGDGVGALEWDRVPVLFIVICAVVTPRPAASTSGYIIMTRVVEDGLVLCGVPRSCSVVGCLSSCEAERPSQLHRPKKAFRRRPVRFDFHQPTDFHCVSCIKVSCMRWRAGGGIRSAATAACAVAHLYRFCVPNHNPTGRANYELRNLLERSGLFGHYYPSNPVIDLSPL